MLLVHGSILAEPGKFMARHELDGLRGPLLVPGVGLCRYNYQIDLKYSLLHLQAAWPMGPVARAGELGVGGWS